MKTYGERTYGQTAGRTERQTSMLKSIPLSTKSLIIILLLIIIITITIIIIIILLNTVIEIIIIMVTLRNKQENYCLTVSFII